MEEAKRIRRLALVAIGGQAMFPVGWLVAGALTDGYSHDRQYVSELGGRWMDHAEIFHAGLLALGISWIALGLALRRALPDRRRARAATALFVVIGLAAAFVVALPVDCSTSIDETCAGREGDWELSWQHYAHGFIAWIEQLLLAATPFAIAAALPAGTLRKTAVALGAIGLIFGAAQFGVTWIDDDHAGIYQRAGLVIVQGWSCLIAAALLLVSYVRPAAATSADS